MGEQFSISKENQRRMLELAREVIRAGAEGHELKVPSYKGDDPELGRPSAVFVTLHKQGRLRGCIGTTQAMYALHDAVADYASAAAFEDPRFEPVKADEVAGLHIEISVLSPMHQISSPDEIIPFVHGVVVKRGRRAGLFLPQVWEQLPDKEQFMGYLCAEKAGLVFEAWKQPDVELYVFTVVAFEEDK